MFDGLLGRAPIYTRNLDLFAYDLKLCGRHPTDDKSTFGQNAFTDLLMSASEEVNLNQIIGRRPGFIKVPEKLLSDSIRLIWPKDQIVLNVDEQCLEGNCQLARLCDLASQGYRFILESQAKPNLISNIPEFANFWSFDAEKLSAGFIDQCRDMKKKGMRLLARNIGSLSQFDQTCEFGFDYYQGSYFEHPKLISNLQIPANRVAILLLLAELQDPNVSISTVEQLVKQDTTLSYKLLRLINSAYFGIPKKVESIPRAVVFFGLRRIKNWASVLVISSTDYKPKELLVTSLVRAQTCEALAQALNRNNPEAYYIAGLFSVLDAIMDMPMAKILEHLKLIPEIDEALLEGKGPIGELLESIKAVEQGRYPTGLHPSLVPGTMLKAYLNAIESADKVGYELRH